MASIPNLNTLRANRRTRPFRHSGRAIPANDAEEYPTPATLQATRDRIVQQTDCDASNSRLSAVAQGYLHDEFARTLFPQTMDPPKRYPIINRGTYVRTMAIDRLVGAFLAMSPTQQRKQVVSLGAGSDTRFFRLTAESSSSSSRLSPVEYHEVDFEVNVTQKRDAMRSSAEISTHLARAAQKGRNYHLHALDLRSLTSSAPPQIPFLDPSLPTLVLSECCLCYLAPETASSVVQYFTTHLTHALGMILYEPIRPNDAFGKTMVANLGSRGIHLQTLTRYGSLEAQRERLRGAGLRDGQGARDVCQLWEDEAWVGEVERERVEKLEWLDEVEEWKLLASHYCVAWGWRGDCFNEAWSAIDGSRTRDEDVDDIC